MDSSMTARCAGPSSNWSRISPRVDADTVEPARRHELAGLRSAAPGPAPGPVHCAAGSDGDTNFGVTLWRPYANVHITLAISSPSNIRQSDTYRRHRPRPP